MTAAKVQPVAVPSRRHSKNILESKRRIPREIYNKLRADGRNKHLSSSVVVQHMFRISNILYGNNCLSAFELAKGYTPNTTREHRVIETPQELIEASEKTKARSKPALILGPKSTLEPCVRVGDVVDVYV